MLTTVLGGGQGRRWRGWGRCSTAARDGEGGGRARVREGEGAPQGARERHGPGLELGAPPPWPRAPPAREGEGAPRGAHGRHGHGPELEAPPSPPDLRGSGRRRRRGREGERWEQEGERGHVGPTWQAT